MAIQENAGKTRQVSAPGKNAGKNGRGSGPGQYIRKYGHVSGPAAIFLLVAIGVLFFFFHPPSSGSFDNGPMTAPAQPKSCLKAAVNTPVMVNPASGSGAIMNIYIGADGNRAVGESPPLAIQKGSLCPGSVWIMRKAQFVRTDGHAMQQYQVASWGQVNNNGTQLTVWVVAAPHHGRIPSGPGLYSGSVSLDSAIAQGAQVPVRVHVAYQNVYLIFAFGFLAAFGGFTWAMLLHSATGGPSNKGHLFRNLTLCLAILLAAAIPVVNVQVLAKPDWQGTLSQFIGLATLIGAAAIALTPTLRALVLPRSLLESTSDGEPPPVKAEGT